MNTARSRSPVVSDALGGLAAAALVLPQAMAFGVTLLGGTGLSPGVGAIAGLVGAAGLNLAAGTVGGTRGLISAPTGPVLVLLTGAAAALASGGLADHGLLMGLMMVVILAGIFQLVVALAGGGGMAKFIPYPVVTGFMAGSAILMVVSQIGPISGAGIDDLTDPRRWIPAATAAATVGLMRLVPRLLPAVPGTVAGLVGGTLVYHALVLVVPGPALQGWTIGALPGPSEMQIGFQVDLVVALPWPAILVSALALAVLASVDTLLTSLVADVETGTRHDARRELIGQGLGQILAGFFGGMAGAGTTGATVVSSRTGGRRWPGAFAGLVMLVLLLVGQPVGTILPISALAGIVIHVGFGMVDRDIWAWVRRRKTRGDAMIAVLVTAVTVGYDLMAAVGVGVVIAVVQFLRTQVRAPVVHRRSTGVHQRSVRHLTDEERALVEANGDRIVLYELRGALFFATVDRLFEELAPDLERRAWVILHMRRVTQVDLTGVKILQQMARRLEASGGELIFCNVHREMGMGRKVRKTLRKVSPSKPPPKVKTFNGSDEALEYAEGKLLAELGHEWRPSDRYVALADTEVCRQMTSAEVQRFARVLDEVSHKRGARIFAAGERGRGLCIVHEGVVEIRLPTTAHHFKRLATYGPGTVFGEIAFLDEGGRAADAVAVEGCKISVLSSDRFQELAAEHPQTALAILTWLARRQGRHLRWTVGELRRMAQY